MKLLVLCAVLFVSLNAYAQGLSSNVELAGSLRQDLDEAITSLDGQRESEAQERLVLGAEVSQLEQRLIELRRKRDIARLSSQGRKEMLFDLEARNAKYERDFHYMRGIYRDFALQLENQLLVGQKAKYKSRIDVAIETNATLLQQADVLDSALERLASMIGGEVLPAEVVSEDEEVLKGKVINVGPVSWFLEEGGAHAGVTYRENGAARARLIEESASEVTKLFAGETASLKLDVTGGKARAIEQIQGDSGRLFQKGGIWLWVILSIALVSAICGMVKFIQLLKIKDPQSGWVAQVLTAVREGKDAEAEELVSAVEHPVGEVLKNALAYTSAGADVVEEVIYEQLIGVQSQLQKWLPFIAVTAATAPLLGLLGTVSGMIRMFNVITVTGTGDVKPMAGGISEALITTLFGLIVAIPALILHTMLSRRSNGVVQNTEKLGLTFVNGMRKLG